MGRKEVRKFSKTPNELFYHVENNWKNLSDKEIAKVFAFGEDYKKFLDASKTERETITSVKARLREAGFVDYDEVQMDRKGGFRQRGFYFDNRGKALAAVLPGEMPLDEGSQLIISHVDSPRIDVKGHPMYEEGGICHLKTVYYGGIKKYQWTSTFLSLHGKAVTKGGEAIDILIGEDPADPLFVIPDVAIHVSSKLQGERKGFNVVTGEELNVITGTVPSRDVADDAIKHTVLKHLYERYGITERELISAEIEMVPQSKASDVGLDRALIGGYGHDDRACVYTSLRALTDLKKKPKYTCICLFVDKEEISSAGNTSAQSMFVSDVYAEILAAQAEKDLYLRLRKCLNRTKALSADVLEAYNPTFEEVFDDRNSAYLNHGVVISKYNAGKGKVSSVEAHTEYMSQVCRLFEKNGIPWQVGELGKVDEGGGHTVALYLSFFNMDVLDVGPCCLSLHSPVEIISKLDLWHAYQAYRSFYAL